MWPGRPHKLGMRGRHTRQTELISLLDAEALIAPEHPIRRIKRLVDEILTEMNPTFEAMYAESGRASIPPERLLKAKVMQALYSIRSDRQLCERIRFDVLFRWFLDLNLDEPVFDPSTFSHNQERLLEHDVAVIFFNKVYAIARRNHWASDDHFSADGTLINAWGSMKSFKPRDGSGDDSDLNGFADFKGTKRSNATHRSVTDPESRLLRKSKGDVSRLCYAAHAVSENRNGLCAIVRVTTAVGLSESEAALENVRLLRRRDIHPKTVGADAGYHTDTFVDGLRTLDITPHPALHGRRGDMGVKRTQAYEASQVARKRIKPCFSWGKHIGGMRRLRQIGVKTANAIANLTFAVGNLVRIVGLEVAHRTRA